MKAVSHGVIPTCGFSPVYNRYKAKIVRLYLTAEPERDAGSESDNGRPFRGAGGAAD